MRYLIITLAISMFLGCAAQTSVPPETDQIIKNHTVLLDMIVKYIGMCQEKGICPKPEEKKETKGE